ncbi:MAG TPA: hypothetical protein VM621_08180 [Luteibacter sp.]|uniref:hypothetical protein n=1 Tax=Luteibacter sp. TaxID=1886636 RepID=UPI002B7230D9|nr:hypothetical protein [Luteibacter sp.]HVI55014.1 hypothetical protein [Luteibacter sp.]
MKFNRNIARIAVGAALITCQAAALAQSASAALFDGHVAAGLPQAFSLPRPEDDERGPGVDQVVVEEKLETDVVYPDGSHAVTYTGTANGLEATFTRIGDALAIDAFEEKPAADMTALAGLTAAPEPDDVVAPPWADTFAAPHVTGNTTSTPSELQFWIFLHNQSGESNYAKFHNWYIGWWVRDMERTVKPGIPVKVFIKDRIAGVTDFDYDQGTNAEALIRFRTVSNDYLTSVGAVPSSLTKTMLFVDRRPQNWGGDGVYGVALPRDTVAIASGTGPRHIIAHEFGHTLDARHEHGELRFPCVTNMRGYEVPYYSCRIYSGHNDTLIRNYVRRELDQ